MSRKKKEKKRYDWEKNIHPKMGSMGFFDIFYKIKKNEK